MKPPHRAGFSLLEVILAISILLGSAIVLAELASVGRHHAESAEELAAAQLAARTRLGEILSGAAPLEAVHGVVLQNPPGWVYSVELAPPAGPARQLGLLVLRVTVSRDSASGDSASGGTLPADAAGRKPRKQFTLTRWIRDPNFQGEAASTSRWPVSDLFGQPFDGDRP